MTRTRREVSAMRPPLLGAFFIDTSLQPICQTGGFLPGPWPFTHETMTMITILLPGRPFLFICLVLATWPRAVTNSEEEKVAIFSAADGQENADWSLRACC